MTIPTLNIPSAVTNAEVAALRKHARGNLVLEVGSLLGFSTVHLASVAVHVVSVDPHEGYPVENPRPTFDKFVTNIKTHGVMARVTPIVGRDDILPILAPKSFGMALIDTTGEYEDTYRIIRRVVPLLRHTAVLAVHDCGHPDWPGALDAVRQFATEDVRPFELIDRLAIFEGAWH